MDTEMDVGRGGEGEESRKWVRIDQKKSQVEVQ